MGRTIPDVAILLDSLILHSERPSQHPPSYYEYLLSSNLSVVSLVCREFFVKNSKITLLLRDHCALESYDTPTGTLQSLIQPTW